MRGKLALRAAAAGALAAAGLAACLGDGGEAGRDQAAAPTPGPAGSAPTRITLVAAGRAAGGEGPKVAVLVDGRPVGEAVTVRADHDAGEWETHEFTATVPPEATLGVRYLNDGGERDLWIRRLVVGGAELPLERATYLRDGRDPLPGQGRMRWGGELRFEP